MAFIIDSWNPAKWRFEKYTNGDSFLSVGSLSANFKGVDNILRATMDQYALFICLKITADICRKARLEVQTLDGAEIPNDPLIKILRKPNYLQHQGDLIAQWVWYKLAFGTVALRPVMPAGFQVDPSNVVAFYNLNTKLIKYPENFRTPMIYKPADIKAFEDQIVQYKDGKDVINIRIKELIYCYDTAAGINGNMLESPSRIAAVKKGAANIDIALDAENIMLRSNGREMFTGGSQKGEASGIAMPMDAGDRKEIQDKLINYYGMGRAQVRSIVTKQGINWKSLHIALKDLGLWESSTKNAAIIRAAFNIPETVFKLYLEKGDTFENKKEGEVELIQNVGQTQMTDFCDSLNNFFKYEEQGRRLVAKFDHLEAMQYIEERRADRFLKISTGVRNLTQAGFDQPTIQAALENNNINFDIQDNGQ